MGAGTMRSFGVFGLSMFTLVSASLVSALAACGGGTSSSPAAEATPAPTASASGTTAVVDLPPPANKPSTPPKADTWAKVPDEPTSVVGVIPLGTVLPGEQVTFDLPAGVLGFNVVARGSGQELAIKDIKAPSGSFVHKDMVPFSGTGPTSMSLFGEVASAGVPQSNHPEAMPTVAPGKWTVVFSSEGSVEADIRYQHTPDGVFHGGYVDIHAYLPVGLEVDSDVVDADNFEKLDGVRERLDAFGASIKKLYGLSRGNVTFHLTDAKYLNLTDSKLGRAFKETKSTKTGVQALHIFFAEPTKGQGWWGIAGGIPGAATVTGTTQSAVALAVSSWADADAEGFVLAHEMGHFFGLNHITEFDGYGNDPLEDTKECPNMTQSNFFSCPDASNIMAASGATRGSVFASKLQQRVVQGSPIFRAFTSGTTPMTTSFHAPDFGKMFGHPGVAPSGIEAVVLAASCGHVSHGKVRVTPSMRVELTQLAQRGNVSPLVRNLAETLAAQR
jgi:hypothetical protein